MTEYQWNCVTLFSRVSGNITPVNGDGNLLNAHKKKMSMSGIEVNALEWKGRTTHVDKALSNNINKGNSGDVKESHEQEEM